MKHTLVSICLLLNALAFAQNEQTAKIYPHPYIQAGMAESGGGYSTFSFMGGPGVDVEEHHFIADGNMFWQNAGKPNDGTAHNGEGHELAITGEVFFKTSGGLLLGGGLNRSKTITANYTKQAYYPRAAIGRDLNKFRLTAGYFREERELTYYPSIVQFTPGPGQEKFSYTCHCDSGTNGIEAQLWYPSPAANHHLFFHAIVQAYRFHTTVTDPYNTTLTKEQESAHNWSGGLTYQVEYRF